MGRYQVIVGNIGTACDTDDLDEAHRAMATYRSFILAGEGRAADYVSLLEGDELLADWHASDGEGGLSWDALYVCDVVVQDPETGNDVELEVWKCRLTGGIMAIDASYLDQVREKVSNPYMPGGYIRVPEDQLPHERKPIHQSDSRRLRRIRCNPARGSDRAGDS